MSLTTDRPTHRSELRVRYAETDRMGVAYYANYLIWFEVARTSFLREHGLRYRDLEARGHLLPVGEVHMRMIASARYDDLLAIDCWLSEVRSRKIVFGYEVFRIEDGGQELLVRGTTALMAVDGDMKPSRLPEDLLAKFQALTGSVA
jgi:acyl-CoA thioester hydrolase